MPGGFSDFLEAMILRHIFIEDYSPGDLYLGLCTANPTETGTGAACFEVSNIGTNYARVLTEPGDWELGVTPGTVYSKEAITFNIPSGDWGLLTYFVILDSGTYGQGNMLIWSFSPGGRDFRGERT